MKRIGGLLVYNQDTPMESWGQLDSGIATNTLWIFCHQSFPKSDTRSHDKFGVIVDRITKIQSLYSASSVVTLHICYILDLSLRRVFLGEATRIVRRRLSTESSDIRIRWTPLCRRTSDTVLPFVPSCAEVGRLLVLPIPPPSPLTPLSSLLPQIPSPPPPPPPPSLLHLPPPVPTSLPLLLSLLPPLPTLLFIPPVDRREDTPKADLPHCKRICLTAPASRYEVGESSTAAPKPTGDHGADYGFIGTMDAEVLYDSGNPRECSATMALGMFG
ncbi:hypothetical protein Tco_0861935 [Tanacetum coccineum]